MILRDALYDFAVASLIGAASAVAVSTLPAIVSSRIEHALDGKAVKKAMPVPVVYRPEEDAARAREAACEAPGAWNYEDPLNTM